MAAILGNHITGTPLTLTDDERRRHIAIVGKTGTGKSTLLQNMMLSDLAESRSFAFLDPHGDVAKTVVDATPKHLVNKMIYFDPQDAEAVVGFNPLETVPEDQRSQIASHIVAAFHHLWDGSWGPRLEYILKHAIRLLLDNNTTLLSLPDLLTNDYYRDKLLKNCTDPYTYKFWTNEYASFNDRLRAEAISPIQNKVGQFTGDSTLRVVLGQPSTINIPDIMNTGKFLVVNLSKTMGEAPAHMLGAFLATAFAQGAETRATVPEAQRRDFTLYVDEFQNFATSSFASILSEARKWRLNLVLANQFLSQVDDDLQDAVLGNVGTLVVLRVSAKDAVILAPELGHTNPAALTDTANYHSWVRVTEGGTPSSAMPISLLPSSPSTGQLPAVQARTRARYARPRELVNRRIETFLSGT